MGAAFRQALRHASWLLLPGAWLCGCIVSVAGLTGGPGDAGQSDTSSDTGSGDALVDQSAVTDGGTDGGNCAPPLQPARWSPGCVPAAR